MSATKSHRELKLVSNNCYDIILLPCKKIYKQSDFRVAQIFKKTLDIREKMIGKRRGYTNKTENISVTKSSKELKLVSNNRFNNVL